MKRNAKIIYISELILLVYLTIFTKFINIIAIDFRTIATLAVLTFMLVILLFFFGFKKDNRYLKGTASRTVISIIFTYMLIIYSLGIILGFNRGYFNKNIIFLIKKILPILLITIEIEIIRYIIIKNSFKNKKTILIFTILCSILNILLEVNLGTLNTSESKFIFLSTIILPIVAQELLCTYITYKVALLPSLIFKLIIKLYVYVLPIVPDLGNYIYSVLNVILPFIIYSLLNKTVIRYEKEKEALNKANNIIFTIPLIALFILLTILISGIFKYKMIAIASNSMLPIYGRGDAVIYEKVKIEDFEDGNILVFTKDSTIVTHRIVRKYKKGDEYYFVTKGDNNNTEDTFIPSENNVLGRVVYKIKYIGYPTVIINDYFRKE